MALDLRVNTAVDVLIGPFVDLTDGATSEAGETPAVKLSKNGQALAAKTDVTVPVYDADGYYNCELDTTDTNTEGTLVLTVAKSATALPVRHEYNVMAEAAWDSLYVAKDDGFMDVNVKTVGRADTQETEASNLEAACAAYSVTRGLSGTALPAAAADAAGGLPISDAGGLDLDNNVSNVLIANNLDHLCKTATAAADMTTEVTDGTIISRMLSKTSDTSTYDVTTDSQEALRDRGDAAWVTATGFLKTGQFLALKDS